LIVRLSAQPTEQIGLNALQPVDAMLQIVRHTVAARLFDQDLMREHAFFARQLSLSTPLVELSYPRDMAKLDEVRSAVTGYLRAGQLSSVG
jgi:hypothetical protein